MHRKKLTQLFFITALLAVMIIGCGKDAYDNITEKNNDYLSSESGEEGKNDGLNQLCIDKTEMLEITFNQGTAKGISVHMKKEDNLYGFNRVLSTFFNEIINYEEIEIPGFDEKNYRLSLRLTDDNDSEQAVLYLYVDDIIRCDGQLYKASEKMDISAINEVLRNNR